MAKWVHRVINGRCSFCKDKTILKYNGYRMACSVSLYNSRHKKNNKKKLCEECGFIPVNGIQMDVHHKDENHKNNNKDNLQILCANCHRLKHL